MAGNWGRFTKYLYKYTKIQAVTLALGLLTTPLSLLNPYLTKLVIDKAYGNKDLKLFFILAFIGCSAFIANSLIGSLGTYLSKRIRHRVHLDITRDLFRHMQNLPLSFFVNSSTGEHLYRIDSDVRRVSDFLCGTIPRIITLVPRILFILFIVFWLNWKLALFAGLLVPLSCAEPYFFGKWLKGITRKVIGRSQNVFKRLSEAFTHIYLIKALGREKHEAERFEDALSKRMDYEMRNVKVSHLGNFSASLVSKLISGAIALYGGYMVIKGAMTLGSLTAVMIYLTQLLGLVKTAGGLYEAITINEVSRERLAEIFDIEPSVKDTEDALQSPVREGKIEFKDVSFGYGKGLVLEKLAFTVESASKIALVGPSGCGKTTLLNLLLRLYDLKAGSILIDGIDIRKRGLGSLRGGIGIALQEPFLWNDTVSENIRYGNLDAEETDIKNAARLAEADKFIERLPEGYDTVLGEMACSISEGQKQRIAIARAVIKKPKLLLLDEAMSSVDSETEEKIVDNITKALKSSTTIVVSHRLSTVRKMELVYFLEAPSVIGIGPHAELLDGNARYRELFKDQISENVRVY